MAQRRCPNCNSRSGIEARFCRECGTRIDREGVDQFDSRGPGGREETVAEQDPGPPGDESKRDDGVDERSDRIDRGGGESSEVGSGDRSAADHSPEEEVIEKSGSNDSTDSESTDDPVTASEPSDVEKPSPVEQPSPAEEPSQADEPPDEEPSQGDHPTGDTPSPTGPADEAGAREADPPRAPRRLSLVHVLGTILGASVFALVAGFAGVQLGFDPVPVAVPIPTVVVLIGVAWLVGTIACFSQFSPAAAVGAGLYLSGAVLVVLPLVRYAPVVLDPTAASPGFGIVNLVLWAFVVPLTGVGLGVVAHLFRWWSARRYRRPRAAGDDGSAKA